MQVSKNKFRNKFADTKRNKARKKTRGRTADDRGGAKAAVANGGE